MTEPQEFQSALDRIAQEIGATEGNPVRCSPPVGARPTTRELLARAFYHRSWVNEERTRGKADAGESNERLEFVGDAVLGFVIAKALYQRWPGADEGRLSKAKARLVSTPALARFARRLELGPVLRLGHGEESSGGRTRPSLLANALEAVIGAIALGEGTDQAEQFTLSLWSPEIDAAASGQETADYKSLLQEHVQKQAGALPEYRVEKILGPDHNRQYEVTVSWQDRVFGRGRGRSKKEAAQAAAAQAFQSIEKIVAEGG